jgi:hypothetical protein
MKSILLILVMALIGYGAGSLILNFINHTQTHAYITGCIEAGKDPMKCMADSQVYVNK